MGDTTTTTFCRLCEVNCGLVATVVDGRLTKLRPDHGHPVTRGFACKKGLLAEAVQNDPDRLDRPQVRTADGFVDTDWDTALAGIADGLRSTIDRYGPRSVAAYIGNPNAFNASAGFSLGFLMAMLGSDRLFSAGSQDCSNKFAISEILYGSAELHPIPDIDNTDHLLLLGTDPRVSKGSFWSIGDPIAALRAAQDRGVTIRFVNPVIVESGSGIGETVQIRPDTDAYLLAAMLHVIDRERGFRPSAPADALTNLDGLRDFVNGFPPERVADVVGIDAATITAMALEFADRADSGRAHVDRGQHGPPGGSGLLVGADAVAGHRQPRPTGRHVAPDAGNPADGRPGAARRHLVPRVPVGPLPTGAQHPARCPARGHDPLGRSPRSGPSSSRRATPPGPSAGARRWPRPSASSTCWSASTSSATPRARWRTTCCRRRPSSSGRTSTTSRKA